MDSWVWFSRSRVRTSLLPANYRLRTNSARSTSPLMPGYLQSISCASPVRRIEGMSVPRLSVCPAPLTRSEEHTSELQSLMRISYAVFCLKKKITKQKRQTQYTQISTKSYKYNNITCRQYAH